MFQDDWDTRTPPKEKVKSIMRIFVKMMSLYFLIYCLKINDNSGEKTCVTSRVPFEREKLDLSIFSFNQLTNDQSFKNIIQEPQIDKSFKNLIEDELNCLDESIRDALVNYTPLKEMINSSFEEMCHALFPKVRYSSM